MPRVSIKDKIFGRVKRGFDQMNDAFMSRMPEDFQRMHKKPKAREPRSDNVPLPKYPRERLPKRSSQ